MNSNAHEADSQIRSRLSQRRAAAASLVQRVRLTKKLASVLNGLDLSEVQIGDVIRVPEATAAMLIREGWAELVKPEADRSEK